MSNTGKCPYHVAGQGTTNLDWWPNQLRVDLLNQHSERSNPLGETFNYAEEFKKIDYSALKGDIRKVLTDSQEWWPADWGSYVGLFIRMAWHGAGTYRLVDGRGGAGRGQQRFAPLGAWPDNANLDKARRLLWPVKQKYGQKISWADLFMLAGNVALESSGFRTFGFAAGRADTWEPDNDVNWGTEKEWLKHRRSEALKDSPLAATEMGLIYVNPEGPEASGDPLSAAPFIRATFGNMAMDDEEIVALIAGGHTLGKTHGAVPGDKIGPDPEAAPIEQQGLGWFSGYGSGKGKDAITSGIEVTWTQTPTQWSNYFFENLFQYEWEQVRSPAGAIQWVAKDAPEIIPDPFDPAVKHKPTMLTTDLTLRFDPAFEKISRRFLNDPQAFSEAFARAWFKLTHRDMGPKARYLGPEVPKEDLIWQDPLPPAGPLPSAADIADAKAKIAALGLSVSELVSLAWASAATFRGGDKRGGANGARLALQPQRGWAVNKIAVAALAKIEGIQASTRLSLADLIVLAGNLGVEQAASAAGTSIEVPFAAGRVDASQEQTDVHSVEYLRGPADGFRNWKADGIDIGDEVLLIDKAQQLTLTAPEMTALLGGLRVLGANWDGSLRGVFTDKVGVLSNDFFVNVLSMDLEWKPSGEGFDVLERKTGAKKYTASRADLVFGSNSVLRAYAEVYAQDGGQQKFIKDFVAAWTKVMNLDRFDLA
ncbi:MULTISPECIES: catalase/peroxidase HPI [Pseudomonadaceae]|jgi:catalase-peroxidase|uniref:Catalase-peroxidase n=1 Tax=Ectopseudomonas oleovorans TaxID=301 RepID=A0A2T5PMG4_ECTOL|nr:MULTISPECIES: catalase/peroxidase HPI [Pseudomonas]MBP8883557.1 catalase/peroxidase HPI [Pseudomonas sp.]MDG9978855.1 catalase/peroxidase HPI [Pseudomonas oleovorans]OWK48567.1 Catalase-peroxidase [Pseudomonas oleovorans subsp. oleovorans]PPV33779.1 catalase/peroxidase HPI [Pseudomonas oleovorans]PTU78957.1 catalase/peroxidase HPI [Pseudomonas indoloxydans]